MHAYFATMKSLRRVRQTWKTSGLVVGFGLEAHGKYETDGKGWCEWDEYSSAMNLRSDRS